MYNSKNLIKVLLFLTVVIFSVHCSKSKNVSHNPGGEDTTGATDTTDTNENKLALNVGTYNLRCSPCGDIGDEAWSSREQWVEKRIQDYDFDILGTQEAQIAQLDDLVEGIPDYTYIAAGRDDGAEKGETSGILYKKDKFKLLDHATFWLSSTPGEPSKGWDAVLNRICTWVKLEDRESGDIFYFFNVHYDHKGVVAVKESSKLILNKIQDIAGDAPVILTGDFNSEPSSEAIKILVDSGTLWDSRTVSKNIPSGPEGTFYGYDLDTPPAKRIDFVFVSESVDVLKYTTIDDDYKTGNIASDHLPVLVEVAL